MHESHDELELLALIEGELRESDAQQVRAKLERDPVMQARVEGMRRDRQHLRSEPEPILPLNFIERIEPMLARPMLMDDSAAAAPMPAPGQFRRQHQRQWRRRSALRFAMAASVGFLVLSGAAAGIALLWTPAAELLATMTSPSPETQNEQVEPRSSGAAQEQSDRLASGSIHHYAPHLVVPRNELALAGQSIGAGAGGVRETPQQTTLLLVIAASDIPQVERHLEELVARLDTRVALVQNFSYTEASELERQWLLAQGRERQQDRAAAEARAGSGRERGHFNEMAERVRQRVNEMGQDEPRRFTSRQLLGERDRAASLADQLEFSSRGATHTITIPAGRLQALLAELQLSAGYRTTLKPLPAAGEPQAASPQNRRHQQQRTPAGETLWLQSLPEVQRQLAELDRLAPDTLIHLPLAIQPVQ